MRHELLQRTSEHASEPALAGQHALIVSGEALDQGEVGLDALALAPAFGLAIGAAGILVWRATTPKAVSLRAVPVAGVREGGLVVMGTW